MPQTRIIVNFIAAGAGAGLLITGCTVGPNYEAPPQPEVPAAWSAPADGGIVLQPLELAQWWMTLDDPGLDQLVDRALQSNHDLRIAAARVREARALRGSVAADGLPLINADGSYTRRRTSENASGIGSGGPLGGSGGNSGGGRDSDLYQIGFDASWELDLFGRVRRSVEAADADVDAAVEHRRDVLVTLLAEVAVNYVDVRGTQGRLAIARGNIQTQQEALDVSQSRYDAGLTSELDVAQARGLLAATSSQIPALEILLRQSIHRLGVLLGQPPESLIAELSSDGPIPAAPGHVPVGLPSDLLRRRPDVRQAERELAAATARIGQATADLFPRFALTGALGLSSDKPANLFNSASGYWSFGPSVVWPLFDAGRIRANIAVQDARTEQALAQYEKTVLISLEETENALIAFAREQTRRQWLAQAVDANRRAVELSTELYTRGLTTYLNVLETQRALYLAQDQLIQSQGSVTANLIALYKALGGGWEAAEPLARLD